MSDTPQKLPRVRQRVEAAVKAKHQAAVMRRSADEVSGMDPTGARYIRKDAADLEAKAETDLCRWSYTMSEPQVGNGGELVPITEAHTDAISQRPRNARPGPNGESLKPSLRGLQVIRLEVRLFGWSGPIYEARQMAEIDPKQSSPSRVFANRLRWRTVPCWVRRPPRADLRSPCRGGHAMAPL